MPTVTEIRWYCLRVEACRAHLAMGFIENLVAEVWYPTIPIVGPISRRYPDGNRRVPMFPGYVLTRFGSDHHWQAMAQHREHGVIKLISSVEGDPLPIPDDFIDEAKAEVAKRLNQFSFAKWTPLSRGTRMRLRRGPFMGHTVVVESHDKWDDPVRVLFSVMGAPRPITVGREDLEEDSEAA